MINKNFSQNEKIKQTATPNNKEAIDIIEQKQKQQSKSKEKCCD